MHRNHGTRRKWSGLPAGEKHKVTTSTLHWTRNSNYGRYQVLQEILSRSLWGPMFISSCTQGVKHQLSKRFTSLGDEVCPDTNDKEPHHASLALASVGMKLRHKKTFSLAMSCSCQRTGTWTSQAQEEEKCSYNPGQLSNFRVSIWQHKSRWPSRHSHFLYSFDSDIHMLSPRTCRKYRNMYALIQQ